jgi:hypothetical protein
MKMSVELLRNPNPAFAGIATIIAKGNPPEWLVRGLEHFSACDELSRTTPEHQKTFHQMQEAADTLLRWLPIFRHLPFGLGCPDDVTLVLDALPRIKTQLDRLVEKPVGRPPDARRKVCAGVIVESWRLIHGKAEPYSLQLQQACKEYWQACGGEEIGETDDLENWRRHALAADNPWIREILLGVQNCIK